MKFRSKLPVLLVTGGLALGLGACEAEGGGTSPGVEDPAVGGDTGADPLAPTGGETGLGEG